MIHSNTPNLLTNIIPTKVAWLKLSGKFPMGLGIPPLRIEIMFESNPLKSIMLVWRFAIWLRAIRACPCALLGSFRRLPWGRLEPDWEIDVCIYIYIYICVCVYIYIERERDKERNREAENKYISMYIYIYIYTYTHIKCEWRATQCVELPSLVQTRRATSPNSMQRWLISNCLCCCSRAAV